MTISFRPAKGEFFKISYMPAKELVVLEMAVYSLHELAETCALIIDAGRPVILNWAEGIVFHHTPLPFNTKELMDDRLKGRIFWASVIFAEMPEYTPRIKVGTRDIPVLATPNPMLKQVAGWLKARLKEK